MAKGLLDLLLGSIFDENWVGRRGEKLTEKELKLVQLLGRKGKTLRNVYLPKDDGETSEVDLIFITQKGIFVFESKNYSGWIFGDEKGRNWTAMLPNKQKNQFYNPIMQNRTHMKWMRNFVGENIPLFSIIVFSERCELKKITLYSDDVKVIKRDRTYATVRTIWEANPDVLSAEQVEELYLKLKELTKVDKSVKEEHIKNIEKKFKSSGKEIDNEKMTEEKPAELFSAEQELSEIGLEKLDLVQHEPMEIGSVVQKEDPIVDQQPEAETPENNTNEEQNLICPKCGNKLVLRTAKKGANAGNQFWGCSGFPKCRFVKNV